MDNLIALLFGIWQAYTLELEAEVAKLKEIKQELQKKQVWEPRGENYWITSIPLINLMIVTMAFECLMQAEFIEKQKNQVWTTSFLLQISCMNSDYNNHGLDAGILV